MGVKGKMIGIIGAMQVELELFDAAMTDKSRETVCGIEFTRGKLWGRETVTAVSGVGKVNAAMCTQIMIMKYSPAFIVNSGVAGGLEPSLGICDAVVASDVVQHDMDTSPLGDPVGLISGINLVKIPCDERLCSALAKSVEECGIHCLCGTIASGDQFISTDRQRHFISETFGAYACEMEAAAIGHVCFRNSLPFCIIRSISDNADNDSPMSYPEFVKAAADNLIKIMKRFFEKL